MKIKKILFLSLIISAILLIPNVVNAAETITIDDIKYTVISEEENNYTVEVSGCEENLKTVIIPDKITENSITYDVISIGANAFASKDFIESITIPNSIKIIGESAFRVCTSLTQINIPSSVETIGKEAFVACYGLTEFNVDAANDKYSSENGVLFNKDKTKLICCPSKIPVTTYQIPNTVISIEDYAFWHCDSLTNIEIPNSVKTIGTNSFTFCNGLMSIDIPNSVTTIGNSAFQCCKSATKITISESVTTIGASAFEECDAVKSIEIPNSITAIPDRMLYGCNSLESAIIPNSITSIGEYAFSLCKSLKNIEIPNSVQEIKSGVFSYCKLIENIKIPNGVTSIGSATFYECSGLKSVEIPSTITEIGFNAFWGCTSLSDITIPATVTSIGENAFYNCSSLKIHAQNDSEAIKYAEQNNINFEVIPETIYSLTLDANGGKYENGNETLKFDDVTKCNLSDIQTPTRSGYKFIGYYTEKTGGKSFNDVMNSEAGIEDDITFYARWEEIPKQENVTKEEPSKELDETPKMGSNIQKDNLILITVLIATSIFKSLMIYKKSK